MFRPGLIVGLLLWAPPIEGQQLTNIGLAPRDDTVLGEIGDVDVLPDGRIVVLDTQADAVYVFHQDGRLDIELGGSGEGPGEIALSAEVEVGPNGEILVVDAQNRRLTMWSREGALLGSSRFDALWGAAPMWPQDLVWNDSGIFLKTSQFVPDRPVEIYTVPIDLQGEGVLLVSLAQDEDALTCVFCSITVDRSGAVVAVQGDTVYSVVRLDSEGDVSRRWTRSDLPAVRRSADELERLRSATRRIAGAEEGGSADFPEHKTRFGRHALNFDGAGRLWTSPRVEDGQFGAFDVFNALDVRDVGGNYSVTIEVDAPINGFRIRGQYLVAASETPIGEPIVLLYRIEG